jgi:hypothetical protein
MARHSTNVIVLKFFNIDTDITFNREIPLNFPADTGIWESTLKEINSFLLFKHVPDVIH